MIRELSPFLSFQGQAQKALLVYADAFPGAELIHLSLFAEGEDGVPGTVRLGVLQIGPLRLRCIDVPPMDAFRFTGGLSCFVVVDTPQEVDSLGKALVEEGSFLMPPDSYDFAKRFAWVQDRFGVHWQIIYGPKLEPEVGN